MDSQNLLDFNELSVYFGESYHPCDKIEITQPSIGDIIAFGDTKFYSVVNTLCANPTSMRLQLWKADINWNKISDFKFFQMIIKTLKLEDTYLLFGDLNLSWFEEFHDFEKDCDELIYVPRDENGNMIDITTMSEDDLIIIDELIYIRIVEYIRYMFNIHPKVEKAKNKATAEAMIWEDEMNENNYKLKHKDDKVQQSILFPLISAALNHPGFKYKKKELREVEIVEFMDSVQRLQIIESTRALMNGMYSGMIDTKGVPSEQFNFMRPIN